MGSRGCGWKEPRAGPALRALPVTPVRSTALDRNLIWQPVEAWQPSEWDAGTRTVPSSSFSLSFHLFPSFLLGWAGESTSPGLHPLLHLENDGYVPLPLSGLTGRS